MNSQQCVVQASAVCVVVGSKVGEVVFSGMAPGFVGLWQLNARIPEGQDVLTGNVLLRVVINRQPSNTVIVAIR